MSGRVPDDEIWPFKQNIGESGRERLTSLRLWNFKDLGRVLTLRCCLFLVATVHRTSTGERFS